ncbi:hypothetical protein K457DRAFT_123899 [Linnemannia elongata AG-77]|uniref:RRM domain-containing protein n=1 Tax=Linnemannia elongata AG-77 TaxID=1314771 RepID=A0A197K363_9FUNG|nr:hypothetical protein K457DRAFT_123899 [Linnemannia elongata AG-77]
MDQYQLKNNGQGASTGAVAATSQPVTTGSGVSTVASAGNASPAGSTAPAFQPDESSKTLYVGNLDQSVNEAALQEIFSQTGGLIESVKIIRDKNFAHQGGLNYGFVEFADHAAAENAIQQMNGRRVYLQEIKVNWAFTGQAAGKEDTATHYHIFIGDISPEINDEALSQAFGAFGTMTDARVMWDSNSGKSRGYGFAAYKERADAERAIASMNGQTLGNRALRCNWASQRGMPGPNFQGMHHGGNSFKMVAGQAPQFNSTVYIGNLPPHTTQEDLVPFFQPFGFVVDMRLQADRGFAFVKLETHEKAANAIVRLAGTMINGRPAKLSWGKDRAAENAARGNHYGYYNNGSGYGMGGHQNNGGYQYSNYNNHNNHNNNHNNNHYGGNGQAYGRNGGHHNNHHHHHNQHHNNQHHQNHHHNNHNQHHHNNHQHNSFQHQQQQQQQQVVGGLDGVPGATGSSALAAGSSALPPSNVAVGSNGSNGNIGQEAYDQFSSFNNSRGN